MEEFQKELPNIYESKKQSIESSPDNILLYDNVNNFIPNNEIDLGCTLLNSNVTSTYQNHSQVRYPSIVGLVDLNYHCKII
jgi:hypothetical protein